LTPIGCGGNSPPANPPAGATSEKGESDMAKMKAELAKLSPDDAASAEKQHVCPVTDKMLGTMGAPQKVDVDGTTVWICCAGCREELLSNKDTYLAKLKKE
jgi:Cu(I)/Ag(I) efflux system membrane fusion protein